jgi:hypothetical protein
MSANESFETSRFLHGSTRALFKMASLSCALLRSTSPRSALQRFALPLSAFGTICSNTPSRLVNHCTCSDRMRCSSSRVGLQSFGWGHVTGASGTCAQSGRARGSCAQLGTAISRQRQVTPNDICFIQGRPRLIGHRGSERSQGLDVKLLAVNVIWLRRGTPADLSRHGSAGANIEVDVSDSEPTERYSNQHKIPTCVIFAEQLDPPLCGREVFKL